MRPAQFPAWISRRFYEATIRSKVIVLIMVSVLAALFLAGIALQTDEFLREKRRLAENVLSIAQVISSNSTAAVAFRDKKTLNELLSSLARRPNLLIGCIYDSSFQTLGSFVRAQERAQCPPFAKPTNTGFVDGRFFAYEPILLENKQIGTLLIISDLREMRANTAFHALITLSILLLAALTAFGLSRRIEHLVSGPVRELAETARTISEKRDYSIRAKTLTHDEMAVLIDAFNHMLGRVEEQNQEHEHLLQEAQNAIKVRDEFLSIASHELRTPLTSLKAGTQLLQRLADKDLIATYPKDRFQKLLASNEHQFTRFSRLVDDLVDVTRISSGHLRLNPERVELEPLIHDMLSQLKVEIEVSKSKIVLDLKGNKPGFWDRLRIEQVVMNLLSNAVKYGAGNPITITTRTDENSALFKIEDQGIGIPAADQARLFHRFERAASSRHFGGLGLGLYITRQIVEAHGGTIRVSSQPRKGTTFTVELPLKAQARAVEQKSA